MLEIEKIIEYLSENRSISVRDKLRSKKNTDLPLIQPRSGVGSFDKMFKMLKSFEQSGIPDILTLTIDSYTRLGHFDKASALKHSDLLNGFPLVSHGYVRCRQLSNELKSPLQVRHGSPISERLFLHSMAAGITAFEGGGISYNLPYSKNHSLEDSLQSWKRIDSWCGMAAAKGIFIDRELFGTLTAVLVPPSLSISISVLEGLLAISQGVKCLSIAYPETGNESQDIASLMSIKDIMRKYTAEMFGNEVAESIEIYSVLHQFMGPFPSNPIAATELIKQGARIARLGFADKIIVKTYNEAVCIPSVEDNISSMKIVQEEMLLCELTRNNSLDITFEQELIVKEVDELLAPVLTNKEGLIDSIVKAFEIGLLDVPFAPSIYAKGKILPARDSGGAIRYLDKGGLSLSRETMQMNHNLIGSKRDLHWKERLYNDIFYFSDHKPKHTNNASYRNKSVRVYQSSDIKRTAILMGAESDAHAVANYVVEKVLIEHKFKVTNLGVCTSLQELNSALDKEDDLSIIVIGSTNGHALSDMEGLQSILTSKNITCPIVLGGRLSIDGSSEESTRRELASHGITDYFDSIESFDSFLHQYFKASKTVA
ncbi:hypothetical protein [Vibrio sp. TRT 17S01]|uniref:hypothetical protein n=1 Tax=Vibrio sp. TRT 17S01 TaxID=3418505 RepID=UPI003CE675C1